MDAFVAEYVAQGFCVFPLPYKSKTPFLGWRWGVLQSRMPTQSELDLWFNRRVNCAIVTGHVSGDLAVLDFDVMRSYRMWQEMTHLESATVITGQGRHIYVRVSDPESLRNGNFLVGGIHAGQIRFTGGYVVAPPSIHPSGRRYYWTTRDIKTVTVQDLCIEQPKKKAWQKPVVPQKVHGQRQTSKRSHPPGGKPDHYVRAVLSAEAKKVEHALPGVRNITLFRAGLKTWRCLDQLGASLVLDTLVQAGMACGLSEQESTVTIHKAWHYGHY